MWKHVCNHERYFKHIWRLWLLDTIYTIYQYMIMTKTLTPFSSNGWGRSDYPFFMVRKQEPTEGALTEAGPASASTRPLGLGDWLKNKNVSKMMLHDASNFKLLHFNPFGSPRKNWGISPCVSHSKSPGHWSWFWEMAYKANQAWCFSGSHLFGKPYHVTV